MRPIERNPAAGDGRASDRFCLAAKTNPEDSLLPLTLQRAQRHDLTAEARIHPSLVAWVREAQPSPGPQAADALDEIRDLCATAAGYAVSIERCAEQGSTARFAFELRQVLACLSERVESLNRARKPEGAQ